MTQTIEDMTAASAAALEEQKAGAETDFEAMKSELEKKIEELNTNLTDET